MQAIDERQPGAGLGSTPRMAGDAGRGDLAPRTRERRHLNPRRERPHERELEIVRLVASGYKNKEVGITLTISERTVKTHLTTSSEARVRTGWGSSCTPSGMG